MKLKLLVLIILVVSFRSYSQDYMQINFFQNGELIKMKENKVFLKKDTFDILFTINKDSLLSKYHYVRKPDSLIKGPFTLEFNEDHYRKEPCFSILYQSTSNSKLFKKKIKYFRKKMKSAANFPYSSSMIYVTNETDPNAWVLLEYKHKDQEYRYAGLKLKSQTDSTITLVFKVKSIFKKDTEFQLSDFPDDKLKFYFRKENELLIEFLD